MAKLRIARRPASVPQPCLEYVARIITLFSSRFAKLPPGHAGARHVKHWNSRAGLRLFPSRCPAMGCTNAASPARPQPAAWLPAFFLDGFPKPGRRLFV